MIVAQGHTQEDAPGSHIGAKMEQPTDGCFMGRRLLLFDVGGRRMNGYQGIEGFLEIPLLEVPLEFLHSAPSFC